MPTTTTTTRRTRRPSAPHQMFHVTFPSGYVTTVSAPNEARALVVANDRRVKDESRVQKAGAKLVLLTLDSATS